MLLFWTFIFKFLAFSEELQKDKILKLLDFMETDYTLLLPRPKTHSLWSAYFIKNDPQFWDKWGSKDFQITFSCTMNKLLSDLDNKKI